MSPWHLNRMIAFDTETTGVNVETDRIVSAAVIGVRGGQDTDTRTWLINCGIDIPEAATGVHGITTEVMKAEGADPADALEEITDLIAANWSPQAPIVGHNVVFDLTILDRELRRHGLIPLVNRTSGPVLDTMVLDRHCAPFRKRVSEKQGPYQMRTTAETYGLEWDDEQAHGAAYDARKSADVAWVMGSIARQPYKERPDWVRELRTSRFDHIAVDLGELHRLQVRWAREDAASYQQWLREKAPSEKRNPAAVVDGTWPLRPVPAGVDR